MTALTLTEFLTARLDEDAESLRDARITDCPEWWMPEQWSRERGLAEVEAKRRIVEEHDGSRGTGCTVCYDMGVAGMGPMAWPCRTLRFLALPYADHPDFRDEWRP